MNETCIKVKQGEYAKKSISPWRPGVNSGPQLWKAREMPLESCRLELSTLK